MNDDQKSIICYIFFVKSYIICNLTVLFKRFLNYTGSLIIGCIANSDILVIALDNRNLYILENETGKHALPPLVLPEKVSHLLLNDTYLLCITCTGLLNVWDIVRLKVVLSEKSLMPILSTSRGEYKFSFYVIRFRIILIRSLN